MYAFIVVLDVVCNGMPLPGDKFALRLVDIVVPEFVEMTAEVRVPIYEIVFFGMYKLVLPNQGRNGILMLINSTINYLRFFDKLKRTFITCDT